MTGNTDQKNSDIYVQVRKKVDFFQEVIQKTVVHVQREKSLDILGVAEVTNCINALLTINDK